MEYICSQCQSQMMKGFEVRAHTERSALKVIRSSNGSWIKNMVSIIFSNKVADPKVAICSHCGSMHWYVENFRS